MSEKRLPFSLSIITDEVSQEPTEAVELAKRFGYEAVELRSVWDTPVELLPEKELSALASMLKDAGLSVSAIASSFMKEDWQKDDREKFERLSLACDALGCKMIRGFSFWRGEAYSDEAFASYLRPYDALLSERGLSLALENDPAVNLSHAGELHRFFSRYDFQRIGILWDPGNEIYTLSHAALSCLESYRLLRPWIRHVHLKDAILKDGKAQGVAQGKGLLDTAGQLFALAEDGYSGYVSLEPHFRLEGSLNEEQLMRPGGREFSEGGYLPSLMSMENLRDILSSLEVGV